jgi:hypothetical protein
MFQGHSAEAAPGRSSRIRPAPLKPGEHEPLAAAGGRLMVLFECLKQIEFGTEKGPDGIRVGP